MTGPEFLLFYVILFLVAVVVAMVLRWRLRAPGGVPAWEKSDLSAYEVAYLQGGEERALNAAIARLVYDRSLTVDAAKRTLKVQAALRGDASGLEHAIYDAIRKLVSGRVGAVRAAAASGLAPIRRRLVEMELLVRPNQAIVARLIPLGVALAAVAVGAVRLYFGVRAGNPVGYLVILGVLSIVIALACFARGVHRSRRGDGVLAKLKEANAALEFQAARPGAGLSGEDLILALGLFGLGIFMAGRLAELKGTLGPPAHPDYPFGGANSCGSNCGGGGGGCGGGGCGGGCGGGGCGG